MKNVIILRYGEIYLKGKNRGYFERVLFENLQKSLSGTNCKISRTVGRYVVSDFAEDELEKIKEKCQKIFGFVSLSVAREIKTLIENIQNAVFEMLEEYNLQHNKQVTTFKVKTKRADKTFPIHSDDFSALMGEKILEKLDNFKVKLTNYSLEVNIDIREDGKTFVFTDKTDCVGGMPVGTSGNGLLMLSGGIDSPVAGYMMAKRGMKIKCLHFHSYPYTSVQAKDKVLKLAKILTGFTGNLEVIFVPFTKIQEEIHMHCDSSYMINIMRRIMFRIAERICEREKLQSVITGENLGQVASQTIESLTSTNSVMKVIPIMRPLIALDKEEIIRIAKQINTFETSILPYEDCCTVFLPDNPIIHPKIENSIKQENNLNIEDLIDEALRNIEKIVIKSND